MAELDTYDRNPSLIAEDLIFLIGRLAEISVLMDDARTRIAEHLGED